MRAIGRERLGWAVAGMLVLALSVAIISPALGGPSVLTLGKAKKVFVTKKKATQTYLTKAAAGQTFLTPAGADFRYVRPVGDTRVSIAPRSWVLESGTANNLFVPHTADAALVRQGIPGDNIDIYGPAPAVPRLYGKELKVSGLEVCYEFGPTAQNEPILDRITVQRVAGSDADPVNSTLQNLFVDETGRVDSDCTTLRFSPVALAANDSIGIGLRFDFSDANTSVRIGRASLILSP